MKVSAPLLLLSVLLSGCSFLGYYKREKAVRVPPEEAGKVKPPESLDGATNMTGPMVAALEVAMNDFLPPGTTVQVSDHYKPLEQCLSRRDTYDVSVMGYGEGLFYVSLSARPERCGLETTLLDAEAEYIVDGKGRILRVR